MNITGYASPVPAGPLSVWVRSIRKAHKLTQFEFAERVSSDRVTVTNWERGKYKPDIESISRISAAFPDAPPPPFLGSSGKRDPLATTDPGLRTPEAREVGHALDRQPKEMREYIRDMVRALVRPPTGPPAGNQALPAQVPTPPPPRKK